MIYFRLRKKTLTEEEIATVLSDTLKGLEYLHLRKKIHRDIKVHNITPPWQSLTYFLESELFECFF